MKTAVTIIRLLVGLLFIFSGLIKANDPLGLAYKMDEYFTVWHFNWAMPYSLPLSIAMNALEIVSGLALILGIWAKTNTRLLLALIIFFTFLTGYAVLSGRIKTCGCFGDCIPLQAWQSFVKDLILLVLILMLAAKHRLINSFASFRAGLSALLLGLSATLYGQYYVLNHLPLVDCLPYAKGKNLLSQMEAPAGSRPDSVTVMYTYKINSQEVSFDAAHFPDNFNDSLYTFIKRETILVRKGNAEPAIKDFALFSVSGSDTTKPVLHTKGHYLFYMSRNFTPPTPQEQELLTKLFLAAQKKNKPFFIITNQPEAADAWFNQNNHFGVPVLTCDGTVMKTILRHPKGIVAMDGATVYGKWAAADMNDAMVFINKT